MLRICLSALSSIQKNNQIYDKSLEYTGDMEGKLFTWDYENHFDPEWFIKNYIDNSLMNIKDKDRILLFTCLDKFNELFSEGIVRGNRLLDIGTGPTVHTVISASDQVAEIYLSDYNTENRRILSDWLIAKRDLDLLSFEHVLEKQKSLLTVAEKQTCVRSRVKGIFPIDITKEAPLDYSEDVSKFDIITTKLCLEAANRSIDEYRQSVCNIMSLLNTGGYIVVAGVLESSTFHVGEYVFGDLFLTKGDVLKTFDKCGAQVLSFQEYREAVPPNKVDDFYAFFVMVAQKC